jgi:hypothetical protein
MSRVCYISVLVCALALGSCWEGTSRQVLASVLSLREESTYNSKEANDFRPIDLQTKLGPGSTLKTSNDGQLNMILIPGALARISGDSELRIEELKLTKDGNETGDAMRERTVRVELRRGAVTVLFEGFARLTIETNQCTITVLPSCLFRLDVNGSRTRLTCVRGKIYAARNPAQISAVGAGYVCEWPSDRGAVPAAGDAQGEIDTTETLQAGRELRDLEAARRDHLPF